MEEKKPARVLSLSHNSKSFLNFGRGTAELAVMQLVPTSWLLCLCVIQVYNLSRVVLVLLFEDAVEWTTL